MVRFLGDLDKGIVLAKPNSALTMMETTLVAVQKFEAMPKATSEPKTDVRPSLPKGESPDIVKSCAIAPWSYNHTP